MSDYYRSEDLARFGETARNASELFERFSAWYGAALDDGALSKREKTLVALGVALAGQCPYCIDAYTQACLEQGLSMEHITEVVHVAATMRAGMTLAHTVQCRNTVEKLTP